MGGVFKNLYSLPSESKYKHHYFCDYIELLALLNNGDSLSKSDILMRFNENYDDENEENVADNNDKDDSYILALFSILEKRQEVFGNFYPFKIRNDSFVSSIEFKYSENIGLSYPKAYEYFQRIKTPKYFYYIFLLLASSLKYIDEQKFFGQGNGNSLKDDFEEFSFLAFKGYLKNSYSVFQFGASSRGKYRGMLQNKVDQLAKDLKISTKYKSHYFHSNNSGDGGLDIVAWSYFLNIDNNPSNCEVYLGQCATGKDWLHKQDDVDKFKNYINFEGTVTKTLFIPYDARNIDRLFTEEKDINNDMLLLDRHRLLFYAPYLYRHFWLLRKDNQMSEYCKSMELVQYAINFEEDIV